MKENKSVRIIAIGGAGGNIFGHLDLSELGCVASLAIDTDPKTLERSVATDKILLTLYTDVGDTTESRIQACRESVCDHIETLETFIQGADAVCIVLGMGGVCGTGVASVVAGVAKAVGVLTVAVVTKPFQLEGKSKIEQAEEGLAYLQKNTDLLAVIPNDKLRQITKKPYAFLDLFSVADNLVQRVLRCVSKTLQRTDNHCVILSAVTAALPQVEWLCVDCA